MKILLVEEHPERERLALMVLESFLEARGHRVCRTDTWAMERDAADFAPDFIVDNLSESPAHFIGKWANLKSHQRNINLVWEQFLNPLLLLRFRFDELLASGLVDGRIAWGEAFRGALLAENPAMNPSRVSATGSIKHATHALLKRCSIEELARAIEIPSGFEERVLFIDSFPAALRDPARERAMKSELGLPYLFEVVRYLQDLRDPAIELLLRLTRENPRSLFILRLHPTKLENYRRHFADLEGISNLFIQSEGDLGPLLRVADLVIASRSGSLVEASIAEKPAVNLRLEDHPFYVAGIAPSIEEAFAPGVDPRDTSLSLDRLRSIAAGFAVDEALKERWIGAPGLTTFERVHSFMGEIMERPPVSRSIPFSQQLKPELIKRRARLELRRRSLLPSPPRETVDHYTPILKLMRREGAL